MEFRFTADPIDLTMNVAGGHSLVQRGDDRHDDAICVGSIFKRVGYLC